MKQRMGRETGPSTTVLETRILSEAPTAGTLEQRLLGGGN